MGDERPAPSGAENDPPVTVAVTRRVKPGCGDALERAVLRAISEAMNFPGHLGANVLRRREGADLYLHSIFKFDRRSNLAAWQSSEQCRKFQEEAERYSAAAPRVELVEGLEAWFDIPERRVVAPARYKMAVVTWLALFPLINLVGWAIAPFLGGRPLTVRILVSTLILTPLMTYLVMPWMTRLFRFWLYPRPGAREEEIVHPGVKRARRPET